MAKTVIIEEFGGPEKLMIVDRDVGDPGPGQLRIRHHAAGLNFIDTYQRTGLYPLELPHALGMEAAGVVEAVGDGVTHLEVGDRVAYATNPPGAYSEARVMPASQVCPLPDGIGFNEAAAVMLKGMTVEYLFHRTTTLRSGDTVLFHAAAGGVGLIACQWAKSEGIALIGTAGTDEKCQLARDHGAAHCINYRTQNFVDEVRRLTDGAGVGVVMDSVGKDTFEGSLDSLKPLGSRGQHFSHTQAITEHVRRWRVTYSAKCRPAGSKSGSINVSDWIRWPTRTGRSRRVEQLVRRYLKSSSSRAATARFRSV